MADQGGSQNEGIVGMFDSPAQGAQTPDWQAMGQQAVTAIPNNISGFGGGWSLSEHELEVLIVRMDDLIGRLEGSQNNIMAMYFVEPPGDDPHSKDIANVMNRSGKVYAESLRDQREYVDGLRRAMKHSLEQYRGVESVNTQSSKRLASDTDGIL